MSPITRPHLIYLMKDSKLYFTLKLARKAHLNKHFLIDSYLSNYHYEIFLVES